MYGSPPAMKDDAVTALSGMVMFCIPKISLQTAVGAVNPTETNDKIFAEVNKAALSTPLS